MTADSPDDDVRVSYAQLAQTASMPFSGDDRFMLKVLARSSRPITA